MFHHRDHLYICGRLDFASALETNDNRSATNSAHMITVGVGALVTNLYAIYIYFPTERRDFLHLPCMFRQSVAVFRNHIYEGWNFNSGNYLFTTDTK